MNNKINEFKKNNCENNGGGNIEISKSLESTLMTVLDNEEIHSVFSSLVKEDDGNQMYGECTIKSMNQNLEHITSLIKKMIDSNDSHNKIFNVMRYKTYEKDTVGQVIVKYYYPMLYGIDYITKTIGNKELNEDQKEEKIRQFVGSFYSIRQQMRDTFGSPTEEDKQPYDDFFGELEQEAINSYDVEYKKTVKEKFDAIKKDIRDQPGTM